MTLTHWCVCVRDSRHKTERGFPYDDGTWFMFSTVTKDEMYWVKGYDKASINVYLLISFYKKMSNENNAIYYTLTTCTHEWI